MADTLYGGPRAWLTPDTVNVSPSRCYGVKPDPAASGTPSRSRSSCKFPITVKVRPFFQYGHPCLRFMRRVAHSVSLVVRYAISVVREKLPTQCRIRGLHAGTKEWLVSLRRFGSAAEVVEYDGEDCFLNTPRDQALPAFGFWMKHLQGTPRHSNVCDQQRLAAFRSILFLVF